MKRSTLDRLVLEQRLDEPAAALALELSGARPDAARWRAFSMRALDAAGIAALGAGAIFFVAANWQEYGVMGRFAILHAAFAVCVGLALWRAPPAAHGQAALVLATLVAGALLALFGQTYQTGADVYELFFAWAALTLPFALAARSGAGWGTWWTVLNVGLALYCSLQDASLGRLAWSGRLGVERGLLLLFACLVNLGGAVLFTHLALPRWLARMATTYGFVFGTIACISVVIKGAGSGQDGVVFAGFIAACLALAYDALRRRTDVFPMAAIFGSGIAISTALIIRAMAFKDIGSVFVVAVWLIGASSGAGLVLMRWVRQWKTPA